MRDSIRAFLTIVSIASIGTGVWWINPSWALIVMGLIVLLGSVLMGREQVIEDSIDDEKLSE